MNGRAFSKRVPMAVMGALVGVSLSMPATGATEADPTTATTSAPPPATMTIVPPGATLTFVPPAPALPPPPPPATPADPPPPPAAPPPPPPEPPLPVPRAETGPPRAVVLAAEAMAVRRAELTARVVEAENNVARVADELAAAERELQTAQSYQQLLAILLNASEADVAKSEQSAKPLVSAYSAPPAASAPPAPEEPQSGPGRLLERVADVGRSVLADRPAAAVQVTDTGAPIRAEALRRREDLSRVASLREGLSGAQQRTDGATAAVAAKAEELEGHRRSFTAAHNALTGALAEMTAVAAKWGSASSIPASAYALAGIPPGALELYRAAATTCPGLPWTVLAAIGHIESWHGRSLAEGVHQGQNFAGAMGPMQFLAPTWTAYGMDGNGDGVRDPYNHADAIHGAANYLCATGGADPARLPRAIWHYNHADWYVRDVLELAVRYGAEA